MMLTKLKMAAMMALVLGVIGLGAGGVLHGAGADKPAVAKAAPAPRGVRPSLAGDGCGQGPFLSPGRVSAVRTKLTQPSNKEITYEANTPLKEALDHLSDVYGIRIVIDTALLKLVVQEGEVENAPVKLATLKGPSLSTVLRLLLAQVDTAVAYRIQPDFVEITGVRTCSRCTGRATISPRSRARRSTRPRRWPRSLPGWMPIWTSPLEEALRELSDLTGVNIVLDGRAGDKGRTPVTARLTDVPLDNAVKVLADMADLTPVVVGRVLYVTSKDNAKALRAERVRPASPSVQSTAKPAGSK